jgi:cellulase
MPSKATTLTSLACLLAVARGEYHPPLTTYKCTTSGGCVAQNTSLVLDSGTSTLLTNAAGSRTAADYATMGVATSGDAVTLHHYTKSSSGALQAASPRVYLLGADGEYVEWSLLNQEVTVTADYSQAPCGENGAFYLSAMQANGKGDAADGTGYCDAQCQGYCCAEMDILEANSQANAMTPHPCQGNSCDKSGCGLNPYANGNHNLWGTGKTVDTSKPVTIVTQFVASGSTLTSINRKYIQNGNTIAGGTITSCNDGQGGLSGMGASLQAGSGFFLFWFPRSFGLCLLPLPLFRHRSVCVSAG